MANRNGGFIGTDGLDAPDPPTAVTPTIGNEQVSVAFTAPTDTGTSAITGFVAQVSTDGTNYSAGSNTGSSSPIVVSSLTNGTAATAKVWAINAYGTSAPSDASASFTPVAAPIALVISGETSSGDTDTINFKDISSTGNFADFGNLTAIGYLGSSVSNATRAVIGHGNNTNVMSYVTPQSTGNSQDFGDLTAIQHSFGSAGNATRGLFLGGRINNAAASTEIDYITIANTGNATDFGDMSTTRQSTAGFASPTRAVAAVGSAIGGTDSVRIDYVTIGSTGNATDFGNAIKLRNINPNGCSSETRGVWGGGSNESGAYVSEYVTIASTGNATEFGNLNGSNISYGPGSASSNTRGIWAGGSGWTGGGNTVVYITIASTGNAADFGNLAYAPVYSPNACSTAHGGLQ